MKGLHPRAVGLVGMYWARFSLRSGSGVMAILVLLVLGLGVSGAFIAPLEEYLSTGEGAGHARQETAAQLDEIIQRDALPIVRWITGGDAEQIAYLLEQNPAFLSAIFIFLLIFFPFVTCLVGFNQTASDIGSWGLRYLLLRTERSNIYMGRLLGAFVFMALGTLLILVILCLYMGFKIGIYGWGELIGWTAQGWLALVLLCLPYLALCAWLSAVTGHAFAALLLSLGVTGGFVLLAHIADGTIPGNQTWLLRLMPWGWKHELLSGSPQTRLLAVAAMVGFTAVFGALGLRRFQRRDL